MQYADENEDKLLREYLRRKMSPEYQMQSEQRLAAGDVARSDADLLSAASKTAAAFGSIGGKTAQSLYDPSSLSESADRSERRAAQDEGRTKELYSYLEGKDRARRGEALASERLDFDREKLEAQTARDEARRGEEMAFRQKEFGQKERLAKEKLAADTAALGMKAEKPPTEQQTSAAMFGRKAQDADKEVENLEASGYNPAGYDAAFRKADFPVIGQVAANPNDRQYIRAQKEFIAAILRKESGGAITPDEFVEYGKIYFAQPGDDKGTLGAKAAARKRATDLLIASSRGAADNLANNPYTAPPRKIETVSLPGENRAVASQPRPPPPGKIRVTNGTETLFIDPADAADAAKEGFK
jgi:hypothetical protein